MKRALTFLVASTLLLASLHWPNRASAQIVRAEYFFDTDPGVGNGTALTVASPSDLVTITETISTTGLEPGYHILFVRTQTAAGNWSLYEPQQFIIEGGIVSAEYFFDQDPGIGNGIPLPVANGQLSFTTSIPTAALPDGDHVMFIRTRHDDDKWSLSDPVAFYIQTRIVEAEYFIDGPDPGFGNGLPLTITTPSDLITINATIPVGALANGDHYLFVRTRDILGNWSFVEPHLFTIDNTVPVELKDFYATSIENQKVRLDWTTVTETQNDFFSLQHSSNGEDFIEIGQVPGAGTTTQPQYYSEVHHNPVLGNNYYRLKQVDLDGRFSYSFVVTTLVSNGSDPLIYPNPAEDEFVIDFSFSGNSGKRLIELLEINGRKCLSLVAANEKIISLSRDGIASGIYLIRITSAEGVSMLKVSLK